MQLMTPMLTSAGLEFAAKPGPSESVDQLYIDRHAVTNAEFATFVAAGNYKEVDLWPQQVLPYVLQFVDASGRPGPQDWKNGEPDPKKINHPVVGISWFEADAYARWIGKQLPSAAQWQRAGTWSTDVNGSQHLHSYPWGTSFDAKRANTWSAGRQGTVAVTEYAEGSTPNGVQQLIGNVWEWTATAFECLADVEDMRFIASQPLVEIRGGAFDTYFPSQATCQFRSAKSLFFRGANVGFRCCVEADSLCQPLDPFELIDHVATT